MSCIDGVAAGLTKPSRAYECDVCGRSNAAAALWDTVTYAPPTSSSFKPGGTEGVELLADITGNSSRLSSSALSSIFSERKRGVLIN